MRPLKRYRHESEADFRIRDTNVRLAECVRSLAVHAPGGLLVTEFLPHHQRVVVDGMRLTRARCEDAITVLHAIIEELDKPTGASTTGERHPAPAALLEVVA